MPRPKGSKNKTQPSLFDLRTSIEKTYRELGGDQWMADWARQEPTEFVRLMSRLLPKQIDAKVEATGPITFVVKRAD
jgi:hypothetical protein